MATATLAEILAELDPEQHAAAVAPRGPVCIIAGAGTGKTRALTHRIAALSISGQVDPRRVLALTFTARAAGEMRGRLRRLGVTGVQARTFHAAALRQLRFFWPDAVGGTPPQVAPTKAPLIAEACRRLRVPADATTVRDLAAEIEWAKVCEVTPEAYAARASSAGRSPVGELEPTMVERIYTGYEAVKRDRSLIDFEDVLLLTAALLAETSAMAQAVREQYRCLLVDEYQDVSPIQQRLLDLWLGDRDDLTVVGDARQTIYSFAGATSRYLVEFPTRFPSATVIRLDRNYRSTPQIVRLANRLMSSSDPGSVELWSQQADGPEPRYRPAADEPAEVDEVTARVRELVADGVPPREIAILYRIHAQSVAFEEALADADIAYTVRGGERFFDRAEVTEAITLLRGAARADEPSDEPLVGRVAAVLSTIGYRPTAPPGPSRARDRWESWAALLALADEVAAATPSATVSDLVDELTARAAASHAPTADAVTLSSLHAAKGLEWAAVFLVGLTDGMVPITYATTPEQVAEERRLLYVGVTRARTHLALSYASARTVGDRRRREPSRFLTGLLPRPGGPEARRARRAGGRARPASCLVCGRALTTASERKLRHCTSCGVEVDLGLFEQLREWRRRTADDAAVPAFVVFTDATLTAIAVERPTDARALLKIPGIGHAKVERYGDALLEVVRAADGSRHTQ